MSVILVVEQDASSASKVTKVLRANGWDVQTVDSRATAIQSAAAQDACLVIVNTTLPEARELLSGFSRRHGGPGAIALALEEAAEGSTAEHFAADEVLLGPFADEDLVATVKRCLTASSSRQAIPSKKDGSKQLTSADIFGDVLAEVEAEAQARPKPKRRPAPESDIESKLEATLSGVMPGAHSQRAASRRLKRETSGDIDSLLDKTLSSLEMPTRGKRLAQTSAAPTPAPKAPSAVESSGQGNALEPPTAVPEPTQAKPEPTQAKPDQKQKARPPIGGPRDEAETAEDRGPKAALDGVLQLRGEDQFRTQMLPTIPLGADTGEGAAFGDYTLLKRIAVGGMAEVWLARRRGVEGFQKTVAIKKILMHLTGTPDFVTMFIDEAKLAAQLNHNNIIQIYDLGKVEDDFFIAMEYVDGKDLRSILTTAKNLGHPVPTELALMVVAAVARALDYAHRKRDFDHMEMGLVHRDVSPQNVLISHEGEIKLCDFGIVKAVAKASITQMGALKGKLQYMSPEQAWGKPVDSRSDLFSLGSVLFELLTGAKLFTGDSEIGVLDAVRECRVRSPRELAPDIPEAVVEIVKKALAKNPDDRYQTAGEMEKDIAAVLNGLEPTPGQTELAGYLQELYQTGSKQSKPAVVAARIPTDAEGEDQDTGDSKPGKTQPGAKSRAPMMIIGGLVAAAVVAVVGIQFGGGRSSDSAQSPPTSTVTSAPAATDETTAEGAFGVATEPGSSPLGPTTTATNTDGEEVASPIGQADGSESLETKQDEASVGGETTADGSAPSAIAETPAADGETEILQQLVDEELAKKREALQQSLEAEFQREKQRLEKEIAKAQDDGEASDGKKDDG